MIKFIKHLIYIVKNYNHHQDVLLARIDKLERIIKEHTVVGVDIQSKYADNHIIVLGKYRNHDFVKSYIVPNTEFVNIVSTLQDLERYYNVQYIDCPPAFKAFVEHDIF